MKRILLLGCYFEIKNKNDLKLGVKKNPFSKYQTEIFIHLFILNYNSNNKVSVTLFSFEDRLAPSVKPVAKNL
ncbi:hypothetical protein FLGSB24_42670 [Flavobacterium sp. GSB-24]|nr:hypothetical protein FLGSB24_42670 [Flavobacterium sp. GSB-24]